MVNTSTVVKSVDILEKYLNNQVLTVVCYVLSPLTILQDSVQKAGHQPWMMHNAPHLCIEQICGLHLL